MNTTFKTRAFYAIQKNWYKKLSQDGFSDIEQLMDDGSIGLYTKNAVGVSGQKYDRVKLEEEQGYYLMAGKFLHDFTFESELERQIFECFSNGESIRGTMNKLSEQISFRQCRNKVNKLKQYFEEYIPNEVAEKLNDE